MTRYADIDKAINLLKDAYRIVNPNYNFMVMSADNLLENILNNAEVDAVEVVRCRDCEYGRPYDKIFFCEYSGVVGVWCFCAGDDYCSRGVRR